MVCHLHISQVSRSVPSQILSNFSYLQFSILKSTQFSGILNVMGQLFKKHCETMQAEDTVASDGSGTEMSKYYSMHKS